MVLGINITKRRAFTLIELLTTMSISSVILLGLAILITHTTAGYSLTQQSIDQISQARAVIHLIETDISCRLPDTPIYLSPELNAQGKYSSQMAFVRVMTGYEMQPEQVGDLATIFYYVAYDLTAQQSGPKLYRKILGSKVTQEILESGDDAAIEPDPGLDEPLLDGVLKFEKKWYARNPVTGLEEPWQVSSNHQPSSLELTIKMVDESFSKRLREKSDWERLAEAPKESQLHMIRTFTHKIRVDK